MLGDGIKGWIVAVMAIGPCAGVALAVPTSVDAGGRTKVPVVAFAYLPTGSPVRGKTSNQTVVYFLKRPLPHTLEYFKPKAGVRVIRYSYAKYAKVVRGGNVVWNFPGGAHRTIHLWLSYGTTLKRGQKINERFLMRSKGYSPFRYHKYEYVYS